MRNQRSDNGFVLVVTLIVVGLVVAAFVTAASVSMVGARRGASFERVSYQALRVSENAVNTFADRLVAAGYTGVFSEPGITGWIGTDVNRLALLVYTDPGGAAVIELRAGSRGDSVNVVATAVVNGGTKTVVREVRRAVGPPLNPGALAPLTSLPAVRITGNATITGQDYLAAGVDGTLQLGAVASVPAPRLEGGNLLLSVSNGVLVRPGFHLDLDGRRYRVDSMANPMTDPAALTLSQVYPDPVGTPLTDVYAASLATKAARSIPLAVGTTVSSIVPSATRVSVPHAGAVRVGSCLRVDLAFDTQPGTFTAEVMDIEDVAAGSVASAEAILDFTSPNCRGNSTSVPARIPAGAALVTDVVSVESAAGVTSGGNSTLTNGSNPNSQWLADLLDPADFRPEELFEEAFGMTKADFIALANTSGQVLNGIARKDTSYNGVTYAPSGADNKSFCGNGFMVIEGDVHFTAGNQALTGECNGQTGFSGIVYITGDFRHQGNSEFRGTVIVQGQTFIDDETTSIGDEDSVVAGTGRKVTYDLASILRAGALVPTLSNPAWMIGTWRQE